MISRGDIYWADLGPAVGSGPAYRRPVLVVSANAFNRSRINTVVALVMSSNLDLARAPGNVELPARESLLPKDSVVNVSQVITLDKSQLGDHVGTVNRHVMQRVEAGIALALGLTLEQN